MILPWYRTWWAYLLYALGAIGTVLFGIRSHDLKRQLAKAEDALAGTRRRQNRLYTNITHEFRTPLTVILGEAAQLEKQAGKIKKAVSRPFAGKAGNCSIWSIKCSIWLKWRPVR